MLWGAHLPTPWIFEYAKRKGYREDYCLSCDFIPQCVGEIPISLEFRDFIPSLWAKNGEVHAMSISTELGHLAVPINFLAQKKK